MEGAQGESSALSNSSLKFGIFEQKGTFLRSDKCTLTLAFKSFKVSLAKENLYINNCKCTDKEWETLSEGDIICFDALPLSKNARRKRKVHARATCGWIGPLAYLSQRFPFRLGVDELLSNLVLAPIVAFPEPHIGVCHINFFSKNALCMLRKEMLCDENGSCRHDVKTLQDVLSVGDLVALHVNDNDINSEGNPFWFNVVACSKLMENCSTASEESSENGSVYTTTEGSHSDDNQVCESESSGTDVEHGDVIYSSCGKCGVFSHLESPFVGVLLYENWKIAFHKNNCFFDRLNWDDLKLKEMQNFRLKFEAIKCSVMYPTQYEALWVWDTNKPSLDKLLNRINNDTNTLPTDTNIFCGTVSTYSLPNVAFINISGIGRNFHVKVFRSTLKKDCNSTLKNFPVSALLKVGDAVQVKVKKNSLNAAYIKHETFLHTSIPSDLCWDFLKKCDGDFSKLSKLIRNRCVQYADGIGTLGAKLSTDEAVFFVRVNSSTLDPKWCKMYAVFIKRADVYYGGVKCQNWDDIHDKEFRVLSHKVKGLPDSAVQCGASQKGICATDSDILDACKKVCNIPVDETLQFFGTVKQYLTYDTVIVECKILNHTCEVLLKHDVLMSSSKTNKFIGLYLSVGDKVTIKVKAEVHKSGCKVFKASYAVKGLQKGNGISSSEEKHAILSSSSKNKLPTVNVEETISIVCDSEVVLPTPEEEDKSHPMDIACSRENNISQCFTCLLQMSGTVSELCSDYEGVVVVDVLKLPVQFHLSDMVFWNDQDDERDKTLPDLTPIGTRLMFSATKIYSSGGDIFRATKVWKPLCRPDLAT